MEILTQVLLLLLVAEIAVGLVGIAILGKVVGCGIPARISGLNSRESLTVGFGMCSKAAITLIVLGIAPEGGLFSERCPTGPSCPSFIPLSS